MNKSLLTFQKGGIFPAHSKRLTQHLPIEDLPVPEQVHIPLVQHMGVPCQPLVKKRDKVVEGDLISDVGEHQGANIHASITGTVKEIGFASVASNGRSPAVIVVSDPEAQTHQYTPVPWRELSTEELIQKIKDAGIVGMGGAGFPTHLKLVPPSDSKIDTLILNGAECEPFLTTDHRIMLEQSSEILEGIRILCTILGIQKCRIGIEVNKEDAIRALNNCLKTNDFDDLDIDVVPLKVKYPQGSEKQLIESIVGRRVPALGLPFDVGVVVHNVGTVKAICDAVVRNKPFYEKVITVSGKGIARPANLNVRIGTRLRDIVAFLGGTKAELAKIVMGGPMMGFAVSSLDMSVTKTTSGVLFLTDEEIDTEPHGQCVRCGWCVEVCPMGLSPCDIGIYVEAGKATETPQFGLLECCECGSCAYICPAKRPLVQFVRLAKSRVDKSRLGVCGPANQAQENQRN